MVEKYRAHEYFIIHYSPFIVNLTTVNPSMPVPVRYRVVYWYTLSESPVGCADGGLGMCIPQHCSPCLVNNSLTPTVTRIQYSPQRRLV